jgi:hypothetical protein
MSLEAYKRHLEDKYARGEALDKELFGIATRLAGLQERIQRASFEDKRRAITELVRGIRVSTEEIQGKRTANVEITYRFEEPRRPVAQAPQLNTLILDGTPNHSLPMLKVLMCHP